MRRVHFLDFNMTMRFGKEIKRRAIKEWKKEFLDYKHLKQALKSHEMDTFQTLLGAEITKVNLFWVAKREWATEHSNTVQRSVETNEQEQYKLIKLCMDFKAELGHLYDYVSLNHVAVQKILKKAVKKHPEQATTLTCYVESLTHGLAMFDTASTLNFLNDMTKQVSELLNRTSGDKLFDGDRKVVSVGCFDLFHRGHSALLMALRQFGNYLIIGIHDDASYSKLKNKPPIDPLEKRIESLKQHGADCVVVIPDTDPTPYIAAAVSQVDIDHGTICYVRGDDMPYFPGREWAESRMPVYLLPRTPNVSSTLVRSQYYADASLQPITTMQ